MWGKSGVDGVRFLGSNNNAVHQLLLAAIFCGCFFSIIKSKKHTFGPGRAILSFVNVLLYVLCSM